MHYGHWLRNGDPLKSKTMHGVPDEDRFWRRVEKTETCWLWTGIVTKSYGVILLNGKRKMYVHRYAHELLIGPIPEGLEVDHLCHVRLCVNPDHLEAVTHEVNIARSTGVSVGNATKTRCPADHEYSPENTIRRKNRDGTTSRVCRECRRTARLKANAS